MQTRHLRPILTENTTVEGFVCKEVEGPYQPELTEDGLHVAGVLLCTEKQRQECPLLSWRSCRRIRISLQFLSMPAEDQES